MKTILVVCPTERDKRELSKSGLMQKYRILFYEYDNNLEKIIDTNVGWLSYRIDMPSILDAIVTYAREHALDGIIYSEDYPGSILGAMAAKQLALHGPDPRIVIGHHHKYFSRLWQKNYVQEATPSFWLLDPHDPSLSRLPEVPFFVKPVKSFFSIFAQEINSYTELMHQLGTTRFPSAFLEPFSWCLSQYQFDVPAHYFIAEELLVGKQCTLEGFVQGGQVTPLGVTDSIMFPGTISFKRFEYPSHLPPSVQDRMAHIATMLMTQTGFDSGFFNIEFMYNPDTDQIAIIEVNTRMASQFADLYEKVDGINSYHYVAAVALGEKPFLQSRQGSHGIAGSCVLRTFENKRVTRIPGPKELDMIYDAFPDVRIQTYLEKGNLLSDTPQDGKSYRYGLVHLGARDSQELQEKFEYCKRILGFEFEPV